jgi:CRISPR-associated protein Cmr6
MLQDLLASLHGLVMSLGGFGRSWRRPAHTYFYHKTSHYSKLVGCHWQWRETVQSHLWIHPSTREELQVFLQKSRTCAEKWLEHTHQLPHVNQLQVLTRPNWREVIHPEQMLIWCRSAKNTRDARAINWFHERPSEDSSQNNQPWKNQDSAPKLYRTDLAGRVLNKKIDNYSTLVGSIWNRMLPVYANNIPFNPQNEFELHSGDFLEIFTIFKHSDNKDSHEFKKLCKHLNSGQSGFFNIKF